MKDGKDCAVYLKRLQFFLGILGNPQRHIPHYIHVAGTSGKGSTVNFLSSILRREGHKTGSLTSPHQSAITERWSINGRHITRADFAALVSDVQAHLDTYIRKSPYDMISYPELMTALGLLHFAREKVQWAVLEAGCGGRYDATNVIPKKDAAVITNIGLDHTDILGNTKEKIAYEKAGIITRVCKVYTAETNSRILAVIEREAKKKRARLITLTNIPSSVTVSRAGTSFEYCGARYSTNAIGRHQAINAALAISIARDLSISEAAITAGIALARQPLRMEAVSQNPLVILDGAHNPDKMKTTVAAIPDILAAPARPIPVHLILGFSANKNISAMVRLLAKLNPASVACTRNTINPFRAAAHPKDIQKKVRAAMPHAATECFLTPADALAWSKKLASKNSLVLATGSLFVSGELRLDIP